MTNLEWPSREHLADLRHEGKFPYSSFFVRTVVLLVVSAVIYSSLGTWIDKLSKLFESVDLYRSVWKELGSMLGELVLLSVLVLVCVILAGLVQSRFYFSAQRFVTRAKERLGFHGGLKLILWLFALCPLLLFSLVVLSGQIVGALSYPQGEVLVVWGTFVRKFFGIAILLAVLASIVAIFLARLIFMYKHRMTREEMLSDSSE